MPYSPELADRIRAALDPLPFRETKMFGGVAFLIDDKIVAVANNAGDLLLKVDADLSQRLLAGRDERSPHVTYFEMGNGRRMSKGWMRVLDSGLENDEQLAAWIDDALDHRHAAGES